MGLEFDLIKKYPWLPSLKKYYPDLALIEPVDFIKDIFSKYNDGSLERRIFNIFKAAFENKEEISDYADDDKNIYIYLIIKILLYLLNTKPISNKVANLYSKQIYKELMGENEDFVLYSICNDLGIDFIYLESPVIFKSYILKDQKETLETNFLIHYIDYLKLAANLRDEYRKLVNNALKNGYVYLHKKDLNRLIQEHVRKKFFINSNVDSKTLEKQKSEYFKMKQFKELYDSILNEWELKKEKFEYSFESTLSFEKLDPFFFPPCIKEILRRADEGQNLNHLERLFLVFFLHALNFPHDDIVNIFSKLPDFDKNKTEYQINFAKKKGYSPHACSTLKALNLCPAQKYKDEICLEGYYSKKQDVQKKISHPLFYVQLKKYRKSITQKNKSNLNKKRNKHE